MSVASTKRSSSGRVTSSPSPLASGHSTSAAACEDATRPPIVVDLAYTADDHAFRESDEYAQAKYDITLRWLGPGQGRRLLNIGCGAGLFNELAHRAGFAVEACEPDPEAYQRAVA